MMIEPTAGTIVQPGETKKEGDGIISSKIRPIDFTGQSPPLSISPRDVEADVNEKTIQLVKLIAEVGPNIAEISKRLGQYKESVRYRFKEKLVNKGFAIQAIVNHEALGLRRIVMKAHVTEEYTPHIQKIFSQMSDFSFLQSYTRTMPEDSYILQASVPREFTEDYIDFMSRLQDKRLFDSLEFFKCDWFRVAPMRAECYDFEQGVWDFDWSRPLPLDERTARATVSETKKVDKIDLLIVKELWKDGNRSLTEVQEAIKKVNGIDINYKTLNWHFMNHVMRDHLIKGYSLRWLGTKYDFVHDKAKHRQHQYLMLSLFVKGVNDVERMSLMGQLNRLPFLWAEAGGLDYFAELAFPIDQSNEALEYLRSVLKPVGTRAEYHVITQKEGLGFTISYDLWDEQNKKWQFEKMHLLERLENLALTIKQSA